MTRALVTQMLEVLESTTYNGPKMGRAITAAREYLATEPKPTLKEALTQQGIKLRTEFEPKQRDHIEDSLGMVGERAELISDLRRIADEGMADYANTGYPNSNAIKKAADMLEADADLRTQLARRTVERDMAISMIGDCIDEQQPKRVPMTDMEIYTALASTVENPEPAEELIGCEEWSEIVDMIRRIESHQKINAPK